ncbi:superoxide dismutase family protein [Wenxinia saemankumensis]|uniref:Superoxide dismutase, Cu-Zn family n=1 Tax=Wenxinia saemankumensis TaxID=1447782 RepID=A0A1M6HRJ6_9RHOB|nr:superoxide dismutase family protein [Wenxinia saemankumensis]SHJ24797.1 superoxide dismutase, Cu-Zn family [Wenxinia saemankumensis]
MFRTKTLPAAILAGALVPLVGTATAQTDGMEAMTADIAAADGTSHGTVTVTPTASGYAIVDLALTGLPGETHGVHIHETGDCSAEDFSSAGGHLAGDRQHGVMVEGGPHPGDLPNVTPDADGAVTESHFNDLLTPDLLADADGSAFIVHSGADDYESQPSGDAGDRIACGVLVAPQ